MTPAARLAAGGAFALLWLPAGLAGQAVARGVVPAMDADALRSLAVAAPCGLPLALAVFALRRAGRRGAALVAFALLAPASVFAVLAAGLLGPAAMALGGILLSVPAWIAWALPRLAAGRAGRRR